MPEQARGWWRSPPARGLLTALVTIDLLFIAAHLGHLASDAGDLLHDPRFGLDLDRGYGEFFGYLQLLATTLLLGRFAARHRSRLGAALATVTGWLLVDDALQMHERGGDALRPLFEPGLPGGLAPDHAGELVVAGLTGLVAFALIALAWRSASPHQRLLGQGAVAALVVLAGFGVVVDAAQSWLGPGLGASLGTLEDGGELLAISSLLAWVVWWLTTD
jgi:hypothetical protein